MASAQNESLRALHAELQNLCLELRSEKLTPRNKAVERLDSILSNRKSDVFDCLSNGNLSWSSLFNNSFEAVIKQSLKLEESKHLKNFSTQQNKNPVYSAVVIKIVDYAIEAKSPIRLSTLLEMVSTGFENSAVLRHFGILLFKIIETGFVIIEENLAGVKSAELNNLLSNCFGAYNENISEHISLLRCLNKIIDLGTKYTQLCTELIKYLPIVQRICHSVENDKRIQQEVIKLTYHFVCNLSVDHDQEICNFLRAIMPAICGYYEFRMKPEIKKQLFELAAICLNIPYLEIEKFETIVQIEELEWKKLIRQIFNLVQTEIKEKSRQLDKSVADLYCEHFLLMASTVCFLVFWTRSVENDSGESRTKIVKPSDKYQGLIDRTSSGVNQLNWGWFIILSDFAFRFQELIDASDYQPMLQTLVTFERAAFTSGQKKSIIEFCKILLKKEQQHAKNPLMNVEFCNKQWKDINDIALNNLQQNSSNIVENQALVQLLLQYRKISNESVMHLIRSLTTKSRNNSTLRTAKMAAKFYKNELLLAPEIVTELIVWLYPIRTKLDVKSVLNYKPTDPILKAEITAMLLIEDDVNIEVQPEFVDMKKETNFDRIKHALQFKYLKKVIFIESRKQHVNNKPSAQKIKSKLILNENYLKILQKSTDFNPRQLSNIAELDIYDLINNMTDLEILLALLITFLECGAFNTDNQQLGVLIKNVLLLLNGIQIQLMAEDISKVETSSIQVVLNKIGSLIEKLYRPDVADFLKENEYDWIVSYLVNGLNWFSNEYAMFETEDMIFRRKMALECIKMLALCRLSSELFKHIQDFEISLDNAEELSAIFEIIELYCKQEKKPYIAIWIVQILRDICKQHHNNMAISTRIIELLPAIAEYTAAFSSLTDDIIVILSSFLKKCYNKVYPPSFVSKILSTVKNIAKIHHESITSESFTQIYLSVNKFMLSSSILIQYAAIECWSYLINEKWIFDDTMALPLNQTGLSKMLWENLKLTKLEGERSSEEMETSTHSVCIQLLLSAFGISFYLQENALVELAKFYFRHEKVKDMIIQGLTELRKFGGYELELICKRNIVAVVKVWLGTDSYQNRSPWFLVSENENKFAKSYESQLYFCALRNSLDQFAYIATTIEGKALETAVQRAIPLCVAFSFPYLRDNHIEMEPYKRQSKQLISNLIDSNRSFDLNAIPANEIGEVLYHAISYLRDDEKFKEFCGFSVTWPEQDISFSYDVCINGIKYFLSHRFRDQKIILDGLMRHKPIELVNLLNTVRIEIEESYCIEAKLLSFFHYSTIVHLIVESFSQDFWQTKLNNIRGFFIRDSIYYLCNILRNPNVELILVQAVTHFLYEFCSSIMPSHSDLVNLHLNIITRSLIGLITRELPEKISNASMDTLYLLVCANSEILSQSIATMDDFPIHDKLERSRESHEKIKYKSQSRSLLNEINYFLQVDNRGVMAFKNLRKYLASKKDELVILCSNANKTTEEVHENCIYQLLKVLLNAIKNRNDEIATEATNCLGELGPSNLGTIALFSDLSESCYKQFHSFEESFDYFIALLIKTIDHLLITACPSKVSLGNKICGHIINSKSRKKCLIENGLLQPYVDSSCNNSGLAIPVNDVQFLSSLESTEQLPYSNWITAFTSSIYSSLDFKSINELAAIDIRFCEKTLIGFFKMLLATNNVIHINSVERLVNHFFEKSFNILNKNNNELNCVVYTDKAIMKYFLNIVECIRMHNQISAVKLKINYLHIGRICVYCEAYFMAVLCLEMWVLCCLENQNNADKNKKSDLIADPHFQSIAKEAFTEIGYLDAVCGFLDPIKSRLDYLALENQWNTVLIELDVELKSGGSNSTYEKYLQRNGFYSLAANVKCDKVNYETLWRLGDWDVLKNDCRPKNPIGFETQNYLEDSFQCYHYVALKSLKKLEEKNTICAIESARKAVKNILKTVSTECSQNMYKYMTWLKILQQIEDFCEIQFPKPTVQSDVLQKWRYETQMDYENFEFKELALSQKIVLFNSAGKRAGRKIEEFYEKENIVGESLLNLIIECKSAGNTNLAIRNIAKLKNLKISKDLEAKVLFEDAEINWKMANCSIAKSILHHITTKDKFAFCLKKVDALRIYGEYLAESNSEPIHRLHKEFFEVALKLLDNFNTNKQIIFSREPDSMILKDFGKYSLVYRKNIHKSIAKYADREYAQLNTYINSEDFQTKIRLIRKHKNEAELLRANRTPDDLRTSALLHKNAVIDDQEIKFAETNRTEYLVLAIKSYIEYCVLDNSIRGTEIFRLISLWFANKHVEEALKIIKDNIETIPSYKFLCVLNQITARLSSNEAEFNTLIRDLLVRCSIDHPHHTLPHVLAIANANKDSNNESLQQSRVSVAKNLISTVKNHKDCSKIVIQMQEMSEVLIEFANMQLPKNIVTLNKNMRKLKNLDSVQCPTLELPVSLDKSYEITSIVKWKDNVALVGGINAPKRVICSCSDGIDRPQLLKGQDDLRQDAIMQQVLGIMNDMLLENKETLQRKLSIRTYKVVPLSMRSGILQWCENTIPIGTYLTGPKRDNGAHKKYRPNDYTAQKCTQLLMATFKNSYEQRLQTYQNVCNRFKPVFQHFFFEKYLNPGKWFEKRLAYTNSVATTSIVGYILGLGDRHSQNILIDEITAEVIHIDFGIAFEQGKVMPTPETVPFRLTRDIVAPFGVCEVSGIFQKSCEKTMTVLRENQNVLITILEVLLYDPLYTWILKQDSAKIEFEKNINKEEKNSTAQRALIRVKSKLMGVEDVGVGNTSVEGQVRSLIKTAMDKRKLSRMFPGWGPHL